MTDIVNVTGAVTPQFLAALNENFQQIDEKLDTLDELAPGHSTTSVAIGIGTKEFAVDKEFAVGSWVIAASDADPAGQQMTGRVLSYADGVLSVDVQTTIGSGTYADWTIRVSGAVSEGPQGPQGLPGSVYVDTSAGLAATTDGDLFQVQGAGDTFARLYKNVSGSAVDQNLSLPSKAYTDTILTKLESQQTVGRPTDAELVDGTAGFTNVYFPLEASVRDGYLRRFRYFGKDTGTAYIRVASVSGTTLTIVQNVAVPITPGDGEAVLDIPVAKGQVVGVYGPGLLAYTADIPDGLGYWYLNGNNTTSGTGVVLNVSDNIRLQVGWDIAFQEVTKADVDEAAATIRTGVEKVQIVGRPLGASLVEVAGISNNTVVLGNVAQHDGWIDQIDYRGMVAGKTWFWGVFTVSGSVKTTTKWRPIISQIGEQSVHFDPVPILAGQAVGYYAYDTAGSQGIISNGSALISDDGYGAWNTGGRVATVNDASLSRAFSSEIRFHLKYIEPVVQLDPLPVYKVFLCVVSQSNIAGRALRRHEGVVSGALMWSVATQALVPLQDPTGTDTTATTDLNGSFAPRFAEVFQERTGYRCVIVNLAVGGTHVYGSDWATTLRAWAATEWHAVVAALDGASMAWDVGGIISGIGEWHANSIDGAESGFTKASYKAAMIDAIENWARALPRMSAKTPVLIFQTGMKGNGDTTGYQQVREAQRELVAERDGYHMGWSGAKTLLARNLMRGTSGSPDIYHYKLQAYDEMGQSGAVVASAVCVGGS